MIKNRNLMKKIEKIFTILFLLSLPFIVYYMASTKSIQKIEGRVVDFGGHTDDLGIHRFLMIKLDTNQTVKVMYQPASGFNVGKKVLLNERVTVFFGMKKYRIIKWYKKDYNE